MNDVRQKLWNDVINICPKQMTKEINQMYIYDRTKFILNGFNCKYTAEWNLVYSSMCKFCHEMYTKYGIERSLMEN